MKSLVPWQDTFSESDVGSSVKLCYIGTYVGSLNSLAQMVDATVEEMQYYDWFEMTYEPDMIDITFDMIHDDLIGSSKPTGQVLCPSCPMSLPSSLSNSCINTTKCDLKAVPIPSLSFLEILH